MVSLSALACCPAPGNISGLQQDDMPLSFFMIMMLPPTAAAARTNVAVTRGHDGFEHPR